MARSASTLRLLGGIMLLDAELTRTAGGPTTATVHAALRRTTSTSVPTRLCQRCRNLSWVGRVIRTGSQYADSANITSISAWIRVDANLSYGLKVDGRKVLLRATVIMSLIDRFLGYSEPPRPSSVNGGFCNPRSLSPEILRSATSLKLPRRRSVLQRYAQQAVMRSWPGSATSPPSREGFGRVFELRVITRS